MTRATRIAAVSPVGLIALAILLTPVTTLKAADTASRDATSQLARQVHDATGVEGGLIVHLHCGDGRLTSALRVNGHYLVQGLATDAGDVQTAREYVKSLRLHGPVSIGAFDGKRLPYIDNLVNLVVAEDLGEVSMDEILRVLVPRGVAYVRRGDEWTKTVKPRPAEIDDWTHVLYDAGGNAVSRDRVAGPPRRLQWTAGPKWTRHHESMSSFQAMVSAGGRVFYLLDEAPQVSLFLPSDWQLTARDAFNGKILWKKKFKSWVTQLMNYKSGPTQCTRHLVADGNRVFVTPGLEEGVHVLDAATGETLRVLEETAATEEILLHDGVLYLMTSDQPNTYPETTRFGRNDWRGQEKWLRAVNPDTGEHLWDRRTPVATMSFAVTGRGVVFHDGKQIRCLALKTGEPLWQSEPVLLDEVIPTSTTPTLVAYKDVVLFIGGKDHGDYRGTSGHYVSQNLRTFYAVSAETGKILWSYKVPATGFECPKDILVLDDLVWIGAIFQGQNSGAFIGRDLHTGEVVREFKPPWDLYWFHQRCYRSKATERFIMSSRTGVEFISPTEGWTSYNHWARGACLYGMMPANGLLYQPPHPCGCYMESLLHGFNALAPASATLSSPSARGEAADSSVPHRATSSPPVPGGRGEEWPTFRHDAARSGSSGGAVAAKLETAWKTDVGESLTAVTVAHGKLFVADKDRHLLHALDAATGKPAWEFMTGGRVDSPPTIFAGRVLFGCRDGYVYCLDASDGQLVWRRRVAPDDRCLVADEQIESVWPVHGSVLIVDGKVYCVAGRSMFLDGGLRLLVLDAMTGEKIAENVMDDVDPTTGESLQLKMEGQNMPASTSDILSFDGTRIYMKSQALTLDGRRPEVQATRDARDQTGPGAHLFAPAGFLDDTAFHRVLMIYGKTFIGGAGSNHTAPKFAPAGKMLVFDESGVYAFSRMPHLHRWVRGLEFHIFAADKQNSPSASTVKTPPGGNRPARPGYKSREPEHIHVDDEHKADMARIRGSLTSTAVNYRWSNHDPAMFGRAMVLADETLFVAGPPAIRNESTEEALQLWQGDEGGILWALSRDNGAKLAEYNLPAAPVFDGMAAAYGRLYVALTDGSIVCLGACK